MTTKDKAIKMIEQGGSCRNGSVDCFEDETCPVEIAMHESGLYHAALFGVPDQIDLDTNPTYLAAKVKWLQEWLKEH